MAHQAPSDGGRRVGPLLITKAVDLAAVKARADAATEGPWTFDEDELTWRLHGTAGIIPPQLDGLIPAQRMTHQILKAPKKGTTYAEYWPNRADADFIVHARTDVPALLDLLAERDATIAGLRAELDKAWKAYADEEYAHGNTIEARDEAQEVADDLTDGIAALLGVNFGEHSNMNDPWQNAVDALRAEATIAGLRAERGAYADRTEALERLLACYRSGSTPRESLHRELARTKAALAAAVTAEQAEAQP